MPREKFWNGEGWIHGWLSYFVPGVIHLALRMEDFEAIRCPECGEWTEGEWWKGLKCGHEIS